MSTEPEISPEVISLLQSNSEAAHFVSDLANGISLPEALKTHFSELLPTAQGSDNPPQSDTPAPAMYQPLNPPKQPISDDEPIDFLNNPSASFWPQLQF